jgi:hypothetical protein
LIFLRIYEGEPSTKDLIGREAKKAPIRNEQLPGKKYYFANNRFLHIDPYRDIGQ